MWNSTHHGAPSSQNGPAVYACVAGVLLISCGGRSALLSGEGAVVTPDASQAQGEASLPCTTNEECGSGKYCRFEQGCGAAGPGTCQRRPDRTDLCFEPIGHSYCGCDGVNYGCQDMAAANGVSIAHRGMCNTTCEGVSCVVTNDCCGCGAIDETASMPPCTYVCGIMPCQSQGFLASPMAYCLQGQCLLTDAKRSCRVDADCTLLNDCCRCTALPAGMDTSCRISCEQSWCDSMGLYNPVARCIQGICKVTLSWH